MSKQIAVVTGCAGFIGITFTKLLLERGWLVYGIDKFTYVANFEELQTLANIYPNTFTYVTEDIKDIDRLPECDVVFNLAAESDVDNSILNMDNFIDSNISGVKNLLEIITHRSVQIKNNKPLFFQVSTDEVYGDKEEGSFDETAALMPSNPYAATKAAADMLVESWSRTHGLDYIIARPSNNYGENQYPEKLIPTVIRRLQREQKIKLHNKGLPVRSWTHVEDTAEAFILLYEKACRNNIYNIQSDYEQNNFVTVTKIINVYFMGAINVEIPNYDEHIDYEYDRPGQDIRYSISCESIKNYGWAPKKNFDKEIVKLVNYYKKRKWKW
jgi:dTDP-glucose 4,6-dehydratase|tara:strand:- start:97 stop:1080 length:984 start_codon:yes stop_codon:yes gene_type:complete